MPDIDFANVKVRVENVTVKGLGRTDDEYVKAQLGDIFNATNFEEIIVLTNRARTKLAQLGCFKAITPTINAAKSKDIRAFDVEFEVEESKTVGGGVHTSIGNNDGSVITNVSFPNLFGRGETLAAEYTYGTRNHTDSRLSYVHHLGMNPKNNISFSFFRSSNDYSWSKYKQEDTGVSVDLTTPFKLLIRDAYVLKGSHIFSYEGTWRNLLSSIDASFPVREQSGHSLKSSLKYTNIIDRRNHAVLPTNGGYLKSTLEVAGLGGDVSFFRADSNYMYTRTLLKYFTTQFTFSGGFVQPLKQGDKVHINDRYFLGGPLTLRGFTQRGAGPHADDCSLGSDAYWLMGLHLYTPLPFMHKSERLSSWFKTHSFLNMGNVFSASHFRSLQENRFEYLMTKARLSVGTGLVISFGSVARVELNYVLPLWKFEGDKCVNGLQFGIGINFN